MKVRTLLQKLTALVASCVAISQLGACSPSVDIALKASFNSPPYLLELLETAAEENETSYFPLLDRIADGYFKQSRTDEELYARFTTLLEEDGHLTDRESLSSFDFALSIHAAAPRIEAQYQFYKTTVEPSVIGEHRDDCALWVSRFGNKYCSLTFQSPRARIEGSKSLERRQFDRVFGSQPDKQDSILYADIGDPSFGDFHRTLSNTAKEGKSSYRLRYKPTYPKSAQPLAVNGYGVELALKRTDYIVIDDREAESKNENAEVSEEGEDIRPLSVSELNQLGLKASSFVMSSEEPFDTLIKLSQDFPKHSSVIASQNISTDFLEEFKGNREILLPAGQNIIWVNGIQLDSRQVDAFALLQHLRRERSYINGLQALGFTGAEAIKILSHPDIAESKSDEAPQRYDFRDAIEGGNVIIWMNNLEKDKRYSGWPRSVTAFLQRTYPGQLPNVRRDLHNLIVPVDFGSLESLTMIVQQLQTFVKRPVPLRIGLVPLLRTTASIEQSKIVYHLFEAYGISAALNYLENSLQSDQILRPNKANFDSVIQNRTPRRDYGALSFEEISRAEALDERLASVRNYVKRLGVDASEATLLINGVALPMNEEWLSAMSNRVTLDLRIIQRAIYEAALQEDSWLPDYFLQQATPRRNPAIIPEDDTHLRFANVEELDRKHSGVLERLPHVQIEDNVSREQWTHLIVIADISRKDGEQLLLEALQARTTFAGAEIVLAHNPEGTNEFSEFHVEDSPEIDAAVSAQYQRLANEAGRLSSEGFWLSATPFISGLGFKPGEQGLVVNGRVVGPLSLSTALVQEDFIQLINYERSKRFSPLFSALESLQLSGKLANSIDYAKISSIVARSANPEMQEGIFESVSTARIDRVDQWKAHHSAISVGDPESSIINIVASVDPTSEISQRWIPILKVLSELRGVHLKLHLNPREWLKELPIKRFYRHVLESKPSFQGNGSLRSLSAHFTDIPKDALLTAGMDVPPSWLVAPRDSVHDLDNIKLTTLKDQTGIEATYELEHILIEGHSRDVNNGSPPRGVQLVLGTEQDPHFADTIVMANLGYFQFKANPGFWKIDLQEGRSQEIFHIDSAGTKGYSPEPGDEISDIELTSFQGKTLFPRLSRKPGQDLEDVLEDLNSQPESGLGYISKGLGYAERVLSNIGFATTKNATSSPSHADINIFSVASGHLYERMLNIMMLSVMKHTTHTVKFWFIEQFLSPSFKTSLPLLAEEYNFQYEMVTYKWPHWLRAQKEKQREIWGYKILFLDVLFPLSLDRVIFVDADQIVRTDMYSLTTTDLEGAPYGFTPMCDSRTSMEGFRFWKQGYWKTFLRGRPYHISALYVVDLRRFRQIAAGDRLRQQYHQLSADPGSLSNLDQDLPNHMQHNLPIHSLDQRWLWCETWCADEDLGEARTIDLCNNPMTKEPKLERARRQVPEWTVLDEEARDVIKRKSGANDERLGKQQEDKFGDDSSANPKSRNHQEEEGQVQDSSHATTATSKSVKDEL
ncbi:MAG: hypothetical protein M1837_006230 [Sclerophora amabilis]|nr:MAG: hypothetical protein M1837_006230 [Sclerophora amabilis]